MVGILNYEEQRLRQQEIEVKALVALCKYGNRIQRFEALKHLQFFAYPEMLAEKINNQETFEKLCPNCRQWDCGAGAAGGDCVYEFEDDDSAALFAEDKK
tara:strand:+ start:174 stop:473 length:300 start_codon:yes stop_codon:yes gene_type:complete